MPATYPPLRTLVQGSEGRESFYRGELAGVIASTVQEAGGYLTVEDMVAHHSEWVDPVSTTYRGVEVFELPPNGQGIAALQILNILEGFPLAEFCFGSIEYVHAFVEANTYAPGKRPFHTIIPAFATRQGKPWLSFGVMGGATQPQAHAQIIINLIDFGMNLQEAGDAPRILHVGSSQPTGEVMED